MAKTTKKVKATETQEKPKTMAARRAAPTIQHVNTVGHVFRNIVSTVLNAKKKTFTSTEIADMANASTRHSRRTLSDLTRRRLLTVQRGGSRFHYSVAKRGRLRQLVR